MATSQIINAINSLLDRLAAIPFDWNAYISAKSNGLFTATDMPDTSKLFQNLAVWNNQPKQWKEKKGMPTSKPNCYIQPILGKAMKLGLGITLYPDFIFRIHIIDFQLDGFSEAGGYNANNELIGGLDQNLEIFQWRDLVKVQLQLFFPLACGAMTVVDEQVDDEHEDIYHYIIDFKTSFRDLKGSPLDPDANAPYVDPPQPVGQFGLNTTINVTD